MRRAATSPLKKLKRSFTGGYIFRGFLGQPVDELVDLAIPSHVIVGLADQKGVSLAPTVGKGETVTPGKVVARGGATTSVRLSSVSGTVEEVRGAGGPSGAIVIRSDGSPGWKPIPGAGPDAAGASPEVIEGIISQSGVAGIPSGKADIHHVIINGVNADIYNPSLFLIAGQRVRDLVSAVTILSRIYPKAAFCLAMDDRARPLGREVQAAAPHGLLSVRLLKPKFPQQKEELLVPVVLGRPVANGHRTSGVLVLDVQSVLAIHDAVVLGKPAIDRVVALGGPGFTRNIHVRVRVGTPVSQVVDSRLRQTSGLRLVENSLLTGMQIADPASCPVGPMTESIIAVPEKERTGFLPFAGAGFRKDSYAIAFASRLLPVGKDADTNLHGEQRACLSCGFCESVCPVRILPGVLHKYVLRGMIDETLVRYGINRCIDCNLCTYVCTSKIDVASLIRKGKARLAITRIPVKEPA